MRGAARNATQDSKEHPHFPIFQTPKSKWCEPALACGRGSQRFPASYVVPLRSWPRASIRWRLRVGLLSDTHGFLDDAVFQHFAPCDEIWHAGDFGSLEVADRLSSFKTLRGVYGNVDGPELRAELPPDLTWECEGMHVYMTHIGGYPGHYDAGIAKKLRQLRPGLFICGHSHILKVMRDRALGLVHMNPGACGHNGWHVVRTLLRFTVEAGEISGVQAIELGPRRRVRKAE